MQNPAVTRSEHCSNCGAERQGAYCHHCGQSYTEHVAPLRDLWNQLVDAFFNWDNRLLTSLNVLFFQPGRLTLEYIAGRRIRFVSPLRLYLVTSILYLFVASLIGSQSFLFTDMFIEGASEPHMQRVMIWMPRAMFVLVPTFAMLIGWFFRKKKRFFVEHLYFVLHVHAVWYMLFLLDAFFRPYVRETVETGMFTVLGVICTLLSFIVRLGCWVYTYKALRVVYEESRGSTMLKTFAVVTLYLILNMAVLLGVVRMFIQLGR